MPQCSSCKKTKDLDHFRSLKTGARTATCLACRTDIPTKSSYEKKRKCAGYPGHNCTKKITDYRCETCWQAVRGGASVYSGDEYGCGILLP